MRDGEAALNASNLHWGCKIIGINCPRHGNVLGASSKCQPYKPPSSFNTSWIGPVFFQLWRLHSHCNCKIFLRAINVTEKKPSQVLVGSHQPPRGWERFLDHQGPIQWQFWTKMPPMKNYMPFFLEVWLMVGDQVRFQSHLLVFVKCW